MKIVMECN